MSASKGEAANFAALTFWQANSTISGKINQPGRCAIKLHLHIGTEKTGTTSFQRWLEQNRAQLAKHDVIYPDLPKMFPHGVGQRILSVYAQGFNPEYDAFAHVGIVDEASYERVKEGFAAVFDAQIRANPAGNWVLSSEHLHSRLTAPAQVETLSRFLRRHFDDITVYIHLRPQVDMARSLASTVARGGSLIGRGFFEAVDVTSAYYNYQTLVARWAAVFGVKNITVIPYKRNPDFQRYLLEKLGLSAAAFPPVVRENESIDWRLMALLNAIRPYQPPDKNGQRLPAAFKAIPCREPLQIGLAFARELDGRMRESNAALIATRPELAPEDLTPDWANYDHPENLSKIGQPVVFAEPLAAVLAQMQGQITQERGLTRLAESERALARGNHKMARKKLALARRLIAELVSEEPVPESLDAMRIRADILHKKLGKTP